MPGRPRNRTGSGLPSGSTTASSVSNRVATRRALPMKSSTCLGLSDEGSMGEFTIRNLRIVVTHGPHFDALQADVGKAGAPHDLNHRRPIHRARDERRYSMRSSDGTRGFKPLITVEHAQAG